MVIHMPVNFKNRIDILTTRIQNITRKERSNVRESLRDNASRIAFRAFQEMRARTPEPQDDSTTFAYRQIGWSKYGEQDYLKSPSQYVAERNFGITLRQGWQEPIPDFRGSTGTTINLNINFSNIAPHARLVLLGEYTKSSWSIPGRDGLRDGRRYMLYSKSGRPFFRFHKYPVKINRPKDLGYLLDIGQEVFDSYNTELINTIEQAIVRDFEIL